MTVVWTPQAEQDRSDIWDHIAADNAAAAACVDQLFSLAAAKLATHPRIGKPADVPGVRELVPHEQYRLAYEIAPDGTVWILALTHTARRWPPLHR
ncbi:MAG: type II toxin-antitoxin system RelE/ParE family toxin [Achromobacter sp.]|nr:type II toxin-antitoxin system RelE/ParE family toxin [Achromobacter sp.]